VARAEKMVFGVGLRRTRKAELARRGLTGPVLSTSAWDGSSLGSAWDGSSSWERSHEDGVSRGAWGPARGGGAFSGAGLKVPQHR